MILSAQNSCLVAGSARKHTGFGARGEESRAFIHILLTSPYKYALHSHHTHTGARSAYRHIPQQYAFADQRYAEGLQR